MATDSAFETRLRAWTYRQLALDRPESSPEALLERLIAVYSSHPSAPLSLATRLASLEPGAFRELESERRAIRVPAMRMSIFLAPVETAPHLFAATRHLVTKLIPVRLEYAGLTIDDYAGIRERVLAIVRTPVSTAELQQAIPIEQRLMTAVRLMAHEGVVLRLGGSLRTDSLRYVATDAWLGAPLAEIEPAAAQRWLALAYLRRFGPARVQDVAWWIGISNSQVRAVLAGAVLTDVGDGYLLPGELAGDFAAAQPLDPEAIALLPKWDVLAMAYDFTGGGRRRFLADRHRPLAYSRMGDGNPIVLQGGEAVATWGHRFAGDRLVITVTPFPGCSLHRPLAESDFGPIAQVLGASDIEIAHEGI